MQLRIKVLGPIEVTDAEGHPFDVGSRRRREVLGRLVSAGGRAVPLDLLVEDLWEDPTSSAAGAVRTFISELRRNLEPDQSPRNRSRLIETVGTGYALRIPRSHVDAYRFEDLLGAVRQRAGDAEAAGALGEALSWWRGDPYEDLAIAPWVTRERARLAERRLQAIELRARMLLDLGRGARLVGELDDFAASHPWREPAWTLFAHALYQADRQVDALQTLRTARAALRDHFGLDPTAGLDRLERDILRHAPRLAPPPRNDDRLHLLAGTETAGISTRLRTANALARTTAVGGGVNLILAQEQRAAAVAEAERTGDVALTARVITAYDVPTIWTRTDDPAQSEALVATARRSLQRLDPDTSPALRARLLATIGLEHRGSRDRWAIEAAFEAERLARELSDPNVLALALNARFVQSFQRPGQTDERDAVAREVIELAGRHDLWMFEILGQLIKIQVYAARGDTDVVERHVAEVERLGGIHETPLVPVLTAAFRAMSTTDPAVAERAYRTVAADLTAMPGIADGFLPLALLSLRLRDRRPAPTNPDLDWGRYRPWVRPLLDLARDDHASARRAVAELASPPADHLYDALWAINAHTAIMLRDPALAERSRDGLLPFRGQIAGGATAMISFGPVDDLLAALDQV